MAKKSLQTILNTIKKYGSGKTLVKLPKSKFKMPKAPKIKKPKLK
jgi:hypothetical protein